MKDRIKYLLKVFCIFCAFGLDVKYYYIMLSDRMKVSAGLGNDALRLGFIGSIIFIFMIYNMYKKFQKKNDSIVVKFLSIMFSLFMVFGYSYINYGNMQLIFGYLPLFILSVLMAIGYYLAIKLAITYIFSSFDNYKVKRYYGKIIDLFKKKPFLFSLIVILICWLPYIISFFPIILSPDPSYQIKQFFGIRTKYADYSILLDEKVVLTNHHPVVHTLLLGGCLKIGHLIGSDNLGLFIYSLIQITILSCTLSYSLKYMLKEMNISPKLLLIFLGIYSFVPMFPFYSMSAVKDVLFTCFVFMYVMFLHYMIKNKGEHFKLNNYVFFFLVMVLVILFRNNGIYVILLSFPFLIILLKNKWKQLLLLFIIVVGFNSCYNKVVLPYYKITSGSIREMLSIPFQQTARYVKYHGEDLDNEEIEIIDKVLGYEDLSTRYNPELSDPVKNKYNKYATNEDLKNYFIVWFKCFFKHPITYINATVDNTYGYFYPEKTSWYIYHKYDKRITEDGFNYHYLDFLTWSRNILTFWGTIFYETPVIGLISNIGFSVWCVFIFTGYLIYKRKYKRIIILLPALISILICIASPANTYFRYAMPFIFTLPFLLACVLEKDSY